METVRPDLAAAARHGDGDGRMWLPLWPPRAMEMIVSVTRQRRRGLTASRVGEGGGRPEEGVQSCQPHA